MARLILFLLFICCVAVTWGSEVLKVGPESKSAYINKDADHVWKEDDKVCFFRDEKPVACGLVVKTTNSFSTVRLPENRAEIKKGDKALYVAPSRGPASATIEETKKKEITYNTVIGLNMALRNIFPKIEFQGLLTPNTAIGIQPSFLRSKTFDQAYSLSAYGVLFTYNYYFQKAFNGPWLQAATGIFLLSENTSGTSVQRDLPAISASLGWRESWGLGLNIGIALGVRYMPFPALPVAELTFPRLQPTVQVDIGFTY